MDTQKTKWFVPAGLLDGDPGVGIRGHIWVSSKPGWEVIGDDAPQFAENAATAEVPSSLKPKCSTA
jgi:hypothetical protein